MTYGYVKTVISHNRLIVKKKQKWLLSKVSSLYKHMIQSTSINAYEKILPLLGDMHREVLITLDSLGSASNTELSQELRWSINRVTPRINELRKKGLVQLWGKRPCKVTGKEVMVWKVADENKTLALF